MYYLHREIYPKKQDQCLQKNNKYFRNIIQVLSWRRHQGELFLSERHFKNSFKLFHGIYINDIKLHETRHKKQKLLNRGKKEKHERSVWMKPWLTYQQQTSAFANIFAELMITERRQITFVMLSNILVVKVGRGSNKVPLIPFLHDES